MLQQLQAYLQTHSQASLGELSCHLRTEPDVLRDMLKRLIRKGRVRQLVSKNCHGCCSCPPASLECYEWVRPGCPFK